MPLLRGRKNIGHNISTEDSMGKPHKQSIAIAFDVSRRKKPKKMASGGVVAESASNESRPSPETKAADASMVSRNSVKKALPDTSFAAPDHRTEQAARGPKMQKIKHPSFAQSPTFKVRIRDQEDDLMDSMPPESPTVQPPEMYDEEDADKSGPDVPALHMKRMAEGGTINKAVSMKDAEEDQVVHPAGLEEDDDQMGPAESEYMSSRMPAYAEGGSIEREMMLQPEPEAEEEHHASVAAAIMAKRRKMMADGGEVDLDLNAEEQPNSFYHQNEDVTLKENYDEPIHHANQPEDSNEHSDDIDADAHDMVSSIRRKMKMRK